MKYLKLYEEKRKAVNPHGEEQWEDPLITKYMGEKLFCLYPYSNGHLYWVCPHCGSSDDHPSAKKKQKMERKNRGYMLDIGILNPKNVGGVGLGIRGNYFDEKAFEMAITKKGDWLGRKLYTLDEIDELLKDMGYGNQLFDDGKDLIVRKIKQTRDGYCSADPDGDRRAGLYVELDEIFN
jgi:hypothetical protein